MKHSEKLKEIILQFAEYRGLDLELLGEHGTITNAPSAQRMIVERMFDDVVSLILQTWNSEKLAWDDAPRIDLLVQDDAWYPVEYRDSYDDRWWLAIEYDYNTIPVEIVGIDEGLQGEITDKAETFVDAFSAILNTV